MKKHRFKIGEKVYYPKSKRFPLDSDSIVTIKTLDYSPFGSPGYRCDEFSHGVADCFLVPKEIYESPLFQTMREDEEES